MKKTRGQTIRLGIVIVAAATATWLVLADTFITPDGLPADMASTAPQNCVAIFVVCMALWFTSLIPLPATGLLAIALLPILGVLPEAKALSLFGNTAVFFMLGVFLLAGAMISTGLSKRITLLALHRFDSSPQRLVTGVTLSAAFLSLWMPSYGVAAMIYPIIVEIVDALGLKRGSLYAKKLFLGLAWGAIIGSCGTFLGGARAPLALTLLHEAHPDKSIGFIQWMVAAMPVVVAMTAIAIVILQRRIPTDLTDISPATRMLGQRVRHLGPMSPREIRLALLWLATIGAWILFGQTLGLAVIATMAAASIFLLRIADWKAVQPYVNWAVLIMYGGAVALGTALSETHAMSWLAQQIITPGAPRLVVLMVIVGLTMLLTEGISNTAAVAILLPIGYSLGELIGAGPVLITLVVTVPAGMTFLFPVSSPPNAISFSAGHYEVREVLRIAWPLSVAAMVVLFVVLVVWWDIVLDIGAW